MLTLVATPPMVPALQQVAASIPPGMGGMRFREAPDPHAEDATDVVLDAAGLVPALDWLDTRPPWAFTPVPLDANGLAAMVAVTQFDWEAAVERVPALRDDLLHVQALAEGYVPDATPALGDDWTSSHNRGVRLHYGAMHDAELFAAMDAYHAAIGLAPTAAHAAYTVRQLVTLLLDLGKVEDAHGLLAHIDDGALPASGRHAVDALRLQVAMARLDPEMPVEAVRALLPLAVRVRDGYESRRAPLAAALVQLDEATLLMRAGFHGEAIAAAEAARAVCAAEESAELAATADLRLGELWHAWAQAGMPDGWKRSLGAYQEALKVFTKESAPAAFASVHHQLAVVYALMPAAEHQRPILLALSGGSFEAALAFFTADEQPLMHARIRTNYGNAMLRCPESRLRDPVARGVAEYREALRVGEGHFSAEERGLVLLNLLEGLARLGWPEGDAALEQARWQELRAVADDAARLPLPTALADELRERLAALDAVAAVGVVSAG